MRDRIRSALFAAQRIWRVLLLPVALLLLSAGPVLAAADNDPDWVDGVLAFDAGDYTTAYNKWLPLANAGDAQAQFNVGFLFDEGLGVDQDPQAAARWYMAAADQGITRAMVNVGVMYFTGVGLPLDYAEAMRWYRMAADADQSPDAQFNIGLLYEGGYGVARDLDEAARWFQLSAEQGDEDAQSHLDQIRSGNIDGRSQA